MSLDAAAGLLVRVLGGRGLGRLAVVGTAALGAALAIALVVTNLPIVNRHDDRTAQAYADAMVGLLPPNAAIFTYWASSPPLWYTQLVDGLRPDLLVVDDTNIVYEGWGNRERRIASVICERPVFVMRPDDKELDPTRAQYALTREFDVRVGRGTPSASQTVPVYRVEPRPGQCP